MPLAAGQPALRPVQAQLTHLGCRLQLHPRGDPHCKSLHLSPQGSPLCRPRSKLCLLGCLLLPLLVQPGLLSLPASLLSLPAACDCSLFSRGQLLGFMQAGLFSLPVSVGHACHAVQCRATQQATCLDAGTPAAGLSARSSTSPSDGFQSCNLTWRQHKHSPLVQHGPYGNASDIICQATVRRCTCRLCWQANLPVCMQLAQGCERSSTQSS